MPEDKKETLKELLRPDYGAEVKATVTLDEMFRAFNSEIFSQILPQALSRAIEQYRGLAERAPSPLQGRYQATLDWLQETEKQYYSLLRDNAGIPKKK